MATEITPPGSFLEAPLTPPPTEEKTSSRSAQRALNCFKLHRAGYRPQYWWQHRLKLADYTETLRVLDSDKPLREYVGDKVRYDYDPCSSSLSIRMPSPVHDVFCAKIVEEILRQLKQFQQRDGASSEFANEVTHLATSRILIPDIVRDGKQTYSQREPDASFKHRRARYPGVIIEVCYSQKSQCVSHLADEYILNTDGSVNAVIALDIDYRGSRKATFTVWRPVYTTVDGEEELRATAVTEAQPFRTDSALPAEDTALQFSLKDFATDDLTQHLGHDQEICITSEKLCDFLSSAEEEQRGQTLQMGSTNRLRPGAKKRRRPETPPEELSSEEEESFANIRTSKRGRQHNSYPSGPSTTT